jgi:hypothetical protein
MLSHGYPRLPLASIATLQERAIGGRILVREINGILDETPVSTPDSLVKIFDSSASE